MNSITEATFIIMSIGAGMAGGLVHFMHMGYFGFTRFITHDDVEEAKKQERIKTLLLRVGYGAMTGLLFAFYWMSPVLSNEVALSRALFWIAISSISASFVVNIARALEKVVVKVVNNSSDKMSG